MRRRKLSGPRIDLDAPLNWDCSSRGWHCCVDKAIPLTPYDVVRLRHSAGKTSQELIDAHEVTFEWRGGLMAAWLAQVPYEGNHRACMFYDELTNTDIARIRDEDPDRFAGFPERVKRAADSQSGGTYRIAGLCGVHMNRPEACRAFPFMLRPTWEDEPDEPPAEAVASAPTARRPPPRSSEDRRSIANFERLANQGCQTWMAARNRDRQVVRVVQRLGPGGSMDGWTVRPDDAELRRCLAAWAANAPWHGTGQARQVSFRIVLQRR